MLTEALTWAFLGTGFTFLCTCLGSAFVFFTRGQSSRLLQRISLGFAAGVMIAASVWSLLIPALDQAEDASLAGLSLLPAWAPAGIGFAAGVFFLMVLHQVIPHLHPGDRDPEGPPSTWNRSALLFTAITLHNIPEGMSVGLLFALAGQSQDALALSAAVALALGIGIQNIPEGAAVSLPLSHDGMSRSKAFWFGSLSGLAEPVFGCAVVLIAATISPFMPWLLSFAAGAMMYVVVEELIPEAHLGEKTILGTLSVMVGFLVMMVLDVALG